MSSSKPVAGPKAAKLPANDAKRGKAAGLRVTVEPHAHIVLAAAQIADCGPIEVVPSPDVHKLQLRVVGAKSTVQLFAWAEKAGAATPLGTTCASTSTVAIELTRECVDPEVWQRLVLTGAGGAAAVIIQASQPHETVAQRLPILARGVKVPVFAHGDAGPERRGKVVSAFLERGNTVMAHLAVREASEMDAGPEHQAIVATLIDGLSRVNDWDTTVLGVKLLITSGKI